jgi:hypothetical protein
MNVRAWLSFAACGVGLVLGGCGGGSTPQAPVAPVVSPLAGNWLITGPMPAYSFTAPGTGVFSLAMTFDVTGNNITASGYGAGYCESSSSPPIFNSAFSFGSLSAGVIAADGSFTLQTPQSVSVYSLSMQGRVPETSAETFGGMYSASFDATIGRGCVGSSSGPFTATSFPLVNGVYNGAGNFQTLTNGVSTATPITVQMRLQQGAPVLDPATGIAKPSNIAIGGSIRVEGFPCFTSGIANTTLFRPSAEPLSLIEGNILSMSFTMDDGSTLNVTGALTDATENHISALLLVGPSAKCGAGSSFFPPIDLIRQN